MHTPTSANTSTHAHVQTTKAHKHAFTRTHHTHTTNTHAYKTHDRPRLSLERQEAGERRLKSAQSAALQCERAAQMATTVLQQKLEDARRELSECAVQIEESVPQPQVEALHR